ncbi:unnamed protein product [Allacma fusca]|uniref:DDE Tnp4 domain-containing protein n=1 Tax=Allacma fusca TaxID=39272 RepID=A0A8J2KCH9_9HEXA|nr:unnamed protein product [Allacma fusca]
MLDWIFNNFSNRIRSLNQPWLTKEKLAQYAEACSYSGSLYPNIVGFIDGTCRPICRPKKQQELYYSGYYKEHLVKYQGLMLPNGLLARVDGPYIGKRHDSAIIHSSKIISEMEEIFVNADGTWFSLYGDSGYANQKFVKVGFKNRAKLSDAQKKFNTDMSALRVSVEYGFGKIIQLFAFLDFKKNQKLLMQDIKKQYIVGGILANCHTCLNGSQVSRYFSCNPPTLEEYLQ